jgi:hypothetical protein
MYLIRRTLRSLGVYLGAIASLALIACSEPTSPPRPTGSASPATSLLSQEVDPAITEFGDVVNRILPTIPDQELATEVRNAFASLDAFIGSTDPASARLAIGRALSLLDRAHLHPANQGAIRLSLLRAEIALEEPEKDR